MKAGESPAGRFVPARTFAEIQDLPNWNDFAPRLGLVYDLFGNGKTALKYSLNRYNLSRTTGIAANYNPLLHQPATLPWVDKNRNDVADGTLRCDFTSPDCEINFATLPANFGIAALNEYGEYPRTWNLEQGVELSHELLDGLSVGGSWWKGSFRNLTNTVNQSWSTADYSPYTWYNPITGQPFQVFARSAAAAARPTRNLDTYDPERKQSYDSYRLRRQVAHPGRRTDRWRRPGRARTPALVHRAGRSELRHRHRRRLQRRRIVRRLRSRHSVASAVQDVRHPGSRLRHQRQHVVPEQLEPDQLAPDDRHPRHDALPRKLPVAVPSR